MSDFTDAFDQLYESQTESVGSALTATIGNVATNKPAIVSDLSADQIFVEGGESGLEACTIQMKASDFSSAPTEGMAVAAGGPPAGRILEVITFRIEHGIYVITAGDRAAENG